MPTLRKLHRIALPKPISVGRHAREIGMIPEFFGRWLRGIARNKFRNDLRSRKRREKRLDSLTQSAVAMAASESSQPDDDKT